MIITIILRVDNGSLAILFFIRISHPLCRIAKRNKDGAKTP